jgi:hypothetical protein
MASAGMGTLRVISAEPPGVKPPGDAMHERVAGTDRYHPLSGLLWAVALHGPAPTLLTEISGRVAYRWCRPAPKDMPPSLARSPRRWRKLRNDARRCATSRLAGA